MTGESSAESRGLPVAPGFSGVVADLELLGRLAVGDLSVSAVLSEVAGYAVRAIPGADGVGLTLLMGDQMEPLVATNQLVVEVEAVQYRLLQGPCVTAAREGRVVVSGRLSDDPRWPEFGAGVAALGVRSALALPVTLAGAAVGAVNVYSRRSDAFDDHSVAVGQLFAVPAGAVLRDAQLLEQARSLAGQLQEALASRTAVDQAVGVLIGRYRVTADEALGRLRAVGGRQGRTLDEVALQAIEATEEIR